MLHLAVKSPFSSLIDPGRTPGQVHGEEKRSGGLRGFPADHDPHTGVFFEKTAEVLRESTGAHRS